MLLPTQKFEGSFVDSFVPHRLMRSGHLQTIVAAYRKSTLHVPIARTFNHRMPDGDELLIHECIPQAGHSNGDNSANRCVIVFHGLCGSTDSPYMRRIADRLCKSGCRTFVVNSRGCGSGAQLANSHTHAGRTDDMASVVQFLSGLYPKSLTTLVGFSLTGSILLSYLGKYSSIVPKQVDSAIAVAPPIDLIACSRHLKKGLARIYDHYFANQLLSQLAWRRQGNPTLVDQNVARTIETVLDFDDVFTAPVAGYKNAMEYYVECSSTNWLHQIEVPVKVLVAEDDPIVPASIFTADRICSPLELCVTRHGGHLGYYGHGKSDDERWWMDGQILRWVNEFSSNQNILAARIPRIDKAHVLASLSKIA